MEKEEPPPPPLARAGFARAGVGEGRHKRGFSRNRDFQSHYNPPPFRRWSFSSRASCGGGVLRSKHLKGMRTIITAGRLITPAEWMEAPVITVESGMIAGVESLATSEMPSGPHRLLDFPGLILAPGWIDVHIHGGAGHDVMEAGDAALARM